MSYSRFLEYLDQGAIRKVDLFNEGTGTATAAIAEVYNCILGKVQRVKVLKEPLRKMEERGVNFAAHPREVSECPYVLDLLGNLAFPLILMGSLLLRNSSGMLQEGRTCPSVSDSNHNQNGNRL